jgi:DNA-directed RNA polymerase subunit K/omega
MDKNSHDSKLENPQITQEKQLDDKQKEHDVEDSPEQETKAKKPTQFLAEDFEELADNVYESIIVIAKRAREIGDRQKKEIDQQLGTTEFTESPEEEQPDEDEPETEYPHFEKPTILAMQEMKKGQLKFNYKK